MAKGDKKKAESCDKSADIKNLNIKTEIIKIIHKSTKISKEVIEKNIKAPFSEMGVDSFALVEVIFAIENRFAITIPQDSLLGVKNLEDLLILIEKLIHKDGQ